jgi:hypothetical protein
MRWPSEHSKNTESEIEKCYFCLSGTKLQSVPSRRIEGQRDVGSEGRGWAGGVGG